jgi:hypothetical protein
MQPRPTIPKKFSTLYSQRITNRTKVIEPGKKSFHSPKPTVATEGTAILSGFPALTTMRRLEDHLNKKIEACLSVDDALNQYSPAALSGLDLVEINRQFFLGGRMGLISSVCTWNEI